MSRAKTLNDVCELIVDCEHKTAPTQSTGYPSIRTPNIGRGQLILDNVNRVSEETYQAWTKRAIPQADDLILAREAPMGNVAIIPKNLKICLGQRTVLIRPNKRKVNPGYLCYLLLGDEVQGKILGISNGATVHHLNMKDIRNLELPELSSLSTQSKIADILSNYDRLIENNIRRIQILEEMARSLYNEWFVKFRFPGHEQTRLVISELGLIPERWKVEKLEN
ncbi:MULTISPECIES: restriction endonuclease subunit S [Trichocoleus]|uniref:Restriction endonuclease subunit S n=1 Tax=Trichocoleus desertorum GB2-A4 TaxID=2933944 RepID=A0ABV0JFD7_9CYAN|nr:restriction endonuclease subunit S [Trichocoleus sp. FACHB-46]MBD1864553.1 restriction endonuclease subunit S [Trichocoleus sp. FACHB-46]